MGQGTRFDDKRLNEIRQKLDQVPETPLQITNADDAPIVILDAGIKLLPDEIVEQRATGMTRQRLWTAKRVEVINNSNKRCVSISLVVSSPPEGDRESNRRWMFSNRSSVKIEPGERYTFTDVFPTLMPFSGDVATSVITVSGAIFDDGSTWGDTGRVRGFIGSSGSGSGYSMGGGAGSGSGGRLYSGDSGTAMIRKSEGVIDRSAIKRVNPEYPPLARAAQVSGSVVVEIVVDENGDVESARALGGHPLLRDASVAAAKEWKFKPTMLSGKPVKVTATLTFNFQM
jgi:protein TonB